MNPGKILSAVCALLLLSTFAHAHGNKYVHPFSITAESGRLTRSDGLSPYVDFASSLDLRIEDANGYNPADPRPELCRPITRGTIQEDDLWNPDNWFPFLQHYWVAWGDHEPWWSPVLYRDHAVEYAEATYRQAVMEYADGHEEEALFDLGRLLHLLEDMGSVPHVYGDSHPDVLKHLELVTSNWLDDSGFENWCKANTALLGTSAAIEPATSPFPAMERLAIENFKATRIRGEIFPEAAAPVSGDLATLFPGADYIEYIPKQSDTGLFSAWHLEGAGWSCTGNRPQEANVLCDLPGTVAGEPNAFYRVPNLPGESGSFFYVENGQEAAIPAAVWSLAAGGWVPNEGRLSLAQLWAGAGDLRATPDQAIEVIPRTIEYTAGVMQHLWDLINPPPHLEAVRIEQDQDGDGRIDAGAGEVIYDRRWREAGPAEDGTRTERWLGGAAAPAAPLPATITLRFSEPVRDVVVALGRDHPTLELVRDGASTPGPRTPDHPHGEPILRLAGVSLSSLPFGPITLFVSAKDLSNHVGTDCSHIDPDPSTRAGRLPNGTWRNYLEEGGEMPGTDRVHRFDLGGFQVRASPAESSGPPGATFHHSIEAKNLSIEPGTEVSVSVREWDSRGWVTDAAAVDGSTFPLPPPESGWQPTGLSLTLESPADYPGRVTVHVDAVAAENAAPATIRDWTTGEPGNDHPDDTSSVADPRYPTPWVVDPASPIGLLLSGWGQGLGHLLGRYGIATAPVSRELEPVGGASPGLASLKALLVGSGGLAGLDRSPSFRGKLARFVAGGGVLIVLTPQRGTELEALPGGEVAGFGWTEDQACFGMAARIASPHVVLSGQPSPWLDAGADGYLTRWPDDAQVLLERTSNLQPAMIRYPYGRGEVFLLMLYPDWGYGAGQSSAAERALVRDLATYALARPASIPEHEAGAAVTAGLTVANGALAPTVTAAIEALTPDRLPLQTHELPLPLAVGDFAEIPLELAPPATLGIHPVSYRLLDGEGALRQETPDAAFFAVRAPFAIAAPATGVRLWVTAATDTVPIGGTTRAVVHVRNGTDRAIAGAVAATWTHLGAGPLVAVPGLAVPPGGGLDVPVDYPVPAPYDFTLAYGFFEEGPPPAAADFYDLSLAHAMKGFTVFSPRVGISLAADGATLLPGHPVAATAALSSAAASLAIELHLRLRSPSNREVWSQATSLELSPEARHAFTLEIAEGEPGPYTLEAEARLGGAALGSAALFLRRAPPALAIEGRHTLPLRIGGESTLSYALRNEEAVALGAGTLRVALVDAAGAEAWAATAEIPALAPAAETRIALRPAIAALPQGDWRLRHEAALPEGAVSGTLLLRHRLAAAVVPAAPTAEAGGAIDLESTLENGGDFLLIGSVAAAAPGLGDSCEAPLALAPGASLRLPCSFALPGDLLPGQILLTLSVEAAGGEIARSEVAVADPRLRMLPLPEEAGAGEELELTLVNAGGSAGLFDYTARLLAPGDAPGPPLAEAAGSCELSAGGSCTARLAVPPGLRTGLYLVTLASQERRTALWDHGADHLRVHGTSAALALRTDRESYAAGDPVLALASVTNGPRALAGATLELSVTGSGGIDPPAFTGTMHVSPGGDDEEGDGGASLPFATPQRAIDAAPPGARVLLHAGTYAPGQLRLREGTILQGEVAGGSPAARIEATDIVGASGIVIDHLELRDVNVFFPAAVAGVRVTDCLLTDLARPVQGDWAGIVFAGTAREVLIGRTGFHRLSVVRPGVVFQGPAAGVRILENDFAEIAAPVASGLQFFSGARDVLIQGNRFAGIEGSTTGVHLASYADAEPLRTVRVLDNRFRDLAGDCSGIHLWHDAEETEVRGNDLAGIEGDCTGIHLWGRVLEGAVSDNRVERLRGDAVGLHLWGRSSAAHRSVAVENNRLEDLAAAVAGDRSNGIQVWEPATGLRVAGNLLSGITDDAPHLLRSGLVISGSGSTGVLLERNVVRGSDVGLALRLQWRGPPPGEAAATVANNLFIANGVGMLEETLVDGGNSLFRDNIVTGSSGAGIRYENPAAIAPTSQLEHNDLHANGTPAEGRPDPTGSGGNIAADPRFLDAAGGDFRTEPGSPCRDAGSLPGFDIGPFDADLAVAIGPRPVPQALLEITHWGATLPLDAQPGAALEVEAPAGALAAAGQLFLRGSLRTASGQALAEGAASFTVGAEPLRLALASPRDAYLPGEPIPVTASVLNTGTDPVAGEVLTVRAGGETVFSSPLALAGGATVELAFETAAEHDLVLHAAAGLAAASLPIAVAPPLVALDVTAPDEAGWAPFALTARLANTGRVPAALTVDLAGEEHGITLGPGEERLLERPVRISADTTLVVRCTGDASAVIVKRVRCGVEPEAGIDAQALYAAGPVTVPVTLGNAGTIGAELPLRVELQQGAGAPRVLLETSRWLAAGATSAIEAALGILEPGSYSLRVATTGAAAQAAFAVLPSVRATICSADAGGPDAEGRLPLAVCVRNEGLGDFAGVLLVSLGAASRARPVGCPVGGETVETFLLPLDGLPAGKQRLRVELSGNGTLQDERELLVPLDAALALAEVPAEVAVTAGAPAGVTVGVRNDGPVRGFASLALRGGDFLDVTATLSVGARSAEEATLSFDVPGDLPGGLVIPASVVLTDLATGATKAAALALRAEAAASLRASALLDAPTYADGEEAVVTVTLVKDGEGTLPLKVLLASGAFREWTDVVLGASATATGLAPHGSVRGLALAPGETSGALRSAALDAGESAAAIAYWGASVPDGAALSLEVRTGPGPTPDASWSPWTPLADGEALPDVPGRFLQYRATFIPSPAGESPLLRWIEFDCTRTGRHLYHSGPDDLLLSPLVLDLPFTVDFAASDQVHVGAYALSGRSLYLDTLPIPRSGQVFTVALDRTRYTCGERITGWAHLSLPGRLDIGMPWQAETQVFAAPTSWPISFDIPLLLRSGTYELSAAFLAEALVIPVDVHCRELRILGAGTDRGAYFPGEEVRLAIETSAGEALDAVALDAWVSDGRSTVPVAAEVRDLARGPNLLLLDFPAPAGPSGPVRLDFAFHLGDGASPRALFLAGGDAAFDRLAPNRPPRADAGPDAAVTERDWLTLDGSASADPDGDPLSFRWEQTSGPPATLYAAGTARPLLLAPAVGRSGDRLTFRLTVSDGAVAGEPDTVAVDVADGNRAPRADAGVDRTSVVGGTASLDGSRSYDPDGDLLSFAWEITGAPEGSAAALDDPAALQPAFAVDRPGDYDVRLRVTDGVADDTDTVHVSTRNSRPVALAGEDRRALPGRRVTLDGSASMDADDDPLTYAWTLAERPEGSAAQIQGAVSALASFLPDLWGRYVAQLVVDDGDLASEPDAVAFSCENAPPVADAGPDRAVRAGQEVRLDGTASRDPDGDPIRWLWAFTTVPEGSRASLDDAGSPTPAFTADCEGTYSVSLVVEDDFDPADPDTAVVTAGSEVAEATVRLRPARIRLGRPPQLLRAWIEPPEGFTAAEIDAASAALVSVGTRTLARPVRPLAAKGAAYEDRDGDGREELVLSFPVRPLRRRLKPGRRNRLGFAGPLLTWGRFLGTGTLKVRR